jgi:hypothetical protein
MRSNLKRARFGSLLVLSILLFFCCTIGQTPTVIAAYLFCIRTRVYRLVRAWQGTTLAS